MQKTVKNYEETTNFGILVCPCCGSTNVIKWGTYERNVIYWKDDNTLKSKVVTIQRIMCNSCNVTHAVLPLGIIPYKQFASEVITRILKEVTTMNIMKLSEQYCISESLIKNWISDFKEKHFSRLKVLLKDTPIKMLEIIDQSIEEKVKYIKQYNRCFMQIKLGVLGLSPS